MPVYRADLHLHTVLSPCGSLEMSPTNIVQAALDARLDMIAITDHNSTKQAPIIRELGKEKGLFVICGAEVTTSEEVHVLALFENEQQRIAFQLFIDEHLNFVKNKPEYFGYQVVVDINDQIIEEEHRLLIAALKANIHEVEKKVHELEGLFIPAHVDRPMNGLISHLGFVPHDLQCDAFGLSARANPLEWKGHRLFPQGAVFIQNSDAHMPEQIGIVFNTFEMKALTFDELRKALHKQQMINKEA